MSRKLFISLFIAGIVSLLSGCGEDEIEQTVRPIPQLTDLNIKQFVHQLQNDYENTLDLIVIAYDENKAKDDPDGFGSYRNLQWTPDYIELKNHYAKVLYENKPFLARKRLLPLFSMFDNILRIGLDLKKAMYDNDERYHFRALDSIAKEKKAFNKIVLTLNAS